MIVVSSATLWYITYYFQYCNRAYYNWKIRCRIDIPNTDPSIHIKIKYTTDKDYSIHGSAMKSVHRNHNS